MGTEENRIALVDLDSVAFGIGWGNKIPDGNGDYLRDEKGRLVYQEKTEEELIVCADQYMNSILTSCNCTHYIAFIKGKNTGSHRYKAKSDYKANRPKESPKWWNTVKTYLVDQWGAEVVNDLEVDDAIAITYKRLPNSFIVAIDKDLLMIEGTNFNWRKGEWIPVNEQEASDFFWASMIIGDKVDGVSGIPGKGAVYASKLDLNARTVFNEYILHYGDDLGIKEFYSNYTCLKLIDELEDFEIPNILKYTPLPIENNEDINDLWQSL